MATAPHVATVDNTEEKRPQFGNRLLSDVNKVFEHNAWDNVVWDEELIKEAELKISEHSEVTFTETELAKYETDADRYWHSFYQIHQNKFFKDRHWLFTEFPELAPTISLKNIPEEVNPGSLKTNIQSDYSSATGENDASNETVVSAIVKDDITDSEVISYPGCLASYRIWEVGCGVGNTVFPVLQTNDDPGLFVYCCDFAASAVQLVKEHKDYNKHRCHAFVYDLTDESSSIPFPEDSVDVIVMIFVLSAIHPKKMQSCVNRLSKYLKPGGLIVFRDYGRHDLAQLRFKKGRCLTENFYARGDGTKVYFFTQDELREMFTAAGLVEVQNLVDRRLQVNRGRQLKMYRVWIQCKYRKPFTTNDR